MVGYMISYRLLTSGIRSHKPGLLTVRRIVSQEQPIASTSGICKPGEVVITSCNIPSGSKDEAEALICVYNM